MSAKKTEETKNQEKIEAAKGCPCMPSGQMPDCCGPEMKEMMSRFIGQLQAQEEGRGAG